MSKPHEDDIAFIRALADLLRDSDLGEIEVKREYGDDDELQVRLTRGAPAPAFPPAPPQYAQPAPSAPTPAAAPVAAEVPADPADHPGSVTSPMVGTAYLSPEPGADPYVRVGDRVEEGQTLLIVEAMKTMNQIPAPRSGVVSRILVDDKQPVEFGAPLMIVE